MVNNVSLVKDSILALRGLIASGVTDPISASRAGSSAFVMTSWPDRPVQYPVIILDWRIGESTRMGAKTEAQMIPITIEAHIRAKATDTRDGLAGSLIEAIRTFQYDNSPASGTINQDLNHFRIRPSINLPPEGPDGEMAAAQPKGQTRERIHTTIIPFSYDYYTK